MGRGAKREMTDPEPGNGDAQVAKARDLLIEERDVVAQEFAHAA
jgi:hypothetical protein